MVNRLQEVVLLEQFVAGLAVLFEPYRPVHLLLIMILGVSNVEWLAMVFNVHRAKRSDPTLAQNCLLCDQFFCNLYNPPCSTMGVKLARVVNRES
jgi:hypothetical protein